jgi:4-alpha-glucanotransferase
MQSYEGLINELSDICGIIPEYWDILGGKHITSLETKKAILKAMKLQINSVDEIKEQIHKLRNRPWNRIIEPVHIISVNSQPFTIPVYIPVKEGEENRLSVSWSIVDEAAQKDEFAFSGDAITAPEQRWIDGTRYIKIDLRDRGNRDIGYYTLNIVCSHPENIFGSGVNFIQKTSRIIITPDACYMSPELKTGKTWGLCTNLYAVRSSENWGAGNFSDLKKLVKFVAELKGGFVGINPLHAIPNKKPFGISPYSPVSRLYKNFIYLDIEKVPEVKESQKAQAVLQSKHLNKELTELRESEFINYEHVSSLKKRILRYAFKIFYERHYKKNSLRAQAFREYILQEGEWLESFSVFLTLWEYMNETRQTHAWQEWPEEYHNPHGTAVNEFKKVHEREMLFYQYLQWLIDEQHKEISEEAKKAGMPIGLYHDLAIGSIGGGSDAWVAQDVIASEMDVGAPLDDFNLNGQNWGFPPLIPDKLRETGYEFFIQTIRKNMKYSGAMRIDHALGMFRLFWIPHGKSPNEGAYVRFPSEDLFRIIALESARNRTMVIAEDLGTIGENVRETLFRFGMLSFRLLYFERNYPDPSFTPPHKYPDMALCAVTTHDLPTIYGYWIGRDLEQKSRLGLYLNENLRQRHIHERRRDRGLLLSVLKSQGILPHDFPSDPDAFCMMAPELCLAIYEYLSRTPCKLVAVTLDDSIGTVEQQNMPGTTNSYPNWVQKTPATIEQILTNKWFTALSEMFKINNRSL